MNGLQSWQNSAASVPPLWAKNRPTDAAPGASQNITGVVVDLGKPAVHAMAAFWSTLGSSVVVGGTRASVFFTVISQVAGGFGRAWTIGCTPVGSDSGNVALLNLAVAAAGCHCNGHNCCLEHPRRFLTAATSALGITAAGALSRQQKDEVAESKWFGLGSGKHASLAALVGSDAMVCCGGMLAGPRNFPASDISLDHLFCSRLQAALAFCPCLLLQLFAVFLCAHCVSGVGEFYMSSVMVRPVFDGDSLVDMDVHLKFSGKKSSMVEARKVHNFALLVQIFLGRPLPGFHSSDEPWA